MPARRREQLLQMTRSAAGYPVLPVAASLRLHRGRRYRSEADTARLYEYASYNCEGWRTSRATAAKAAKLGAFNALNAASFAPNSNE